MLSAMSSSDVFCAQHSAAQQESLDGTAPAAIRYWILVEDNGPWGPKEPNALSLLEPQLREDWAALGKRTGVRRLYLRRPREMPTMPNAPRRCWVGENGPQGGRLVALPPMSIAQLLEQVQVRGLAGLMEQGEPVSQMWLVCTHGRRDRCCSLHGTGVFAGLAAKRNQEVWQCSHLGGHRFAATALHLPSGYLWGRLGADDAPLLAQMEAAGPLVLPEKLRGHSGLCTRGQLVDLAMRRRVKDWSSPCDPQLWSLDPEAPGMVLGELGELCFDAGPTRMVYSSCGDEAPKARRALQVRWVAS